MLIDDGRCGQPLGVTVFPHTRFKFCRSSHIQLTLNKLLEIGATIYGNIKCRLCRGGAHRVMNDDL